MKKSLLLAAAALIGLSAFAQTEAQRTTYPDLSVLAGKMLRIHNFDSNKALGHENNNLKTYPSNNTVYDSGASFWLVDSAGVDGIRLKAADADVYLGCLGNRSAAVSGTTKANAGVYRIYDNAAANTTAPKAAGKGFLLASTHHTNGTELAIGKFGAGTNAATDMWLHSNSSGNTTNTPNVVRWGSSDASIWNISAVDNTIDGVIEAAKELYLMSYTGVLNDDELTEALATVTAPSESVENIYSYFPTATAQIEDAIAAKTEDIDVLRDIRGLSGKIVLIRSALTSGNANRSYLTANTATTFQHHNGEAKVNAAWEMTIGTNGELTLKNCAFGTYVTAVGVLSETASNNRIVIQPSVSQKGTFNIVNNAVSGNNMFHTGAAPTLVNWGAALGSSWTLEEVTDAQLTTWANTAANSFGFTIGNVPGEYVLPEGVTKEKYTELQNTTIKNGDEFNYTACYEAIQACPTIFDLNTMAGPALIRIKTAACNTAANPSKYLSSVNNSSSRSAFTTEATDANTFIYHDNTLVALNSGYHLWAPADGNALGRVQSRTGAASENNAHIFSFVDGTPKSIGTYMLCYGGSNENPVKYYYMFSNGAQTDRGGVTEEQGINYLFGMSNWYGYFYNVEFVNEISVEVTGDKLYRAPVAVELNTNDNIAAYVITVDENNAITTTGVSAADGVVYAAGTGFILHGNGTYTFTAHNGEAGVNTYAANIGGHHKLHSYTPETGKVGLVIKETEVSALANEPTVKMVAIESNDAMAPHAATIELTANEHMNAGKELDVVLGGTTGIREIVADAAANNDAIYDLQGRRLSAPAKGINIIGGRKVLVK